MAERPRTPVLAHHTARLPGSRPLRNPRPGARRGPLADRLGGRVRRRATPLHQPVLRWLSPGTEPRTGRRAVMARDPLPPRITPGELTYGATYQTEQPAP